MQIRFYSFSHLLEVGGHESGNVTMGAVANEYNRQVAFWKICVHFSGKIVMHLASARSGQNKGKNAVHSVYS